MTDVSKRAEAAALLRRLVNAAAVGFKPWDKDIEKCVSMIIDTAKDEIRAELDFAHHRVDRLYETVAELQPDPDRDAPGGGAEIKAGAPGPFAVHGGGVYAWCPGVDPDAVAPQGVAARPFARVTCQCREPDRYCDAKTGTVICNQCGYEWPVDWDKLPPRAPRRDFGPHLCLCVRAPGTRDGRTCVDCGGTTWSPANQVSERGE